MSLFTRAHLDEAANIVGQSVSPTPAYTWPLLSQRVGAQVVVKHENHTPTGSFKARGGLVFAERLRQQGVLPKGLVTATRGNHGQSIAIGARRAGLPAIIVVPEGNSAEKNAAMAAFGGDVRIHGKDFDESRAFAADISKQLDYMMVPSFHPDLVAGVATYGLELFTAHPDLDSVIVPIGMGSGICALIGVRDLLGLKTRIFGVVMETAPAYALSLKAGRVVETDTAATFADGMACRCPSPEALAVISAGAEGILHVTDDQVAQAMRAYYTDTHNLSEGSGAAALAAVMAQPQRFAGKKISVILTGSNVDMPVFTQVLSGKTPRV